VAAISGLDALTPQDAATVLAVLVERAGVGVALIGPDGRYLLVDEQLAAMNGVPAADHLGRTPAEVVPAVGDLATSIVDSVRATGEPVIDRLLGAEPPGEPGRRRFLLVSFLPVRATDGRHLGVAFVARDVTAERELRTRVADERLHATVAATLDPVLLLSPAEGTAERPGDFWIDHANAAAAAEVGQAEGSLAGRRLYDVFPWLPELGLHERYLEVLGGGAPFTSTSLPFPRVDDAVPHGSFDLSVSRVGTQLMVSWRDTTAERDLALHVEQLRRERARTALMQRAFLPRRLPEVAGVRLGARYRSAEAGSPLGGDWYDAIEIDGGLVVSIGDVAGHGVGAVESMAVARMTTRAFLDVDPDPGAALGRLAHFIPAFSRQSGTSVMLTTIVASYDIAARTLRWATAGHPPPLLVTAEGAQLLAGRRGPPVAFDTPAYVVDEAAVPPGALVVLYTDGLIERRGETLVDGFERLLASTVDLPDEPGAACAALMDRCVVPMEKADDVCLVALRTA